MTRSLYTRRPLVAVSIALLLTVTILGAETAAQSLFSLDAASFRQRGGLVYVEVYFLIQRDQLKFTPAVDGFEARCEITINLHSPDTLLSSTNWEIVDQVANLEEINPGQKLPDLVFYNLPPGNYRIECQMRDATKSEPVTRSVDLALQAYPDSGLCISDLELASRLEKGKDASKFNKSGFLVIPNPDLMYGSAMPMLYFYAEIYNLKEAVVDSLNQFTADRVILNSARQEVKRLPQKVHKKVGSSAVEVDGISVAALTSGTYYLKLIVDDLADHSRAEKEVKFFVYRPEDFASQNAPPAMGVPSASVVEYEFNALTDAELDEAIEELKFLVADADWRSAKKLNADGKRQYLIRFWSENDSDPQTRVNEFRQIFLQRKAYCEQRFEVFGKPGWKTDRGRVYLLYGQPEDVEYHPHDVDTRAYEIWSYDSIDGGVIFVFVDRNNYGDYQMMHSTKRGELYKPDWYEQDALIQK